MRSFRGGLLIGVFVLVVAAPAVAQRGAQQMPSGGLTALLAATGDTNLSSLVVRRAATGLPDGLVPTNATVAGSISAANGGLTVISTSGRQLAAYDSVRARVLALGFVPAVPVYRSEGAFSAARSSSEYCRGDRERIVLGLQPREGGGSLVTIRHSAGEVLPVCDPSLRPQPSPVSTLTSSRVTVPTLTAAPGSRSVNGGGSMSGFVRYDSHTTLTTQLLAADLAEFYGTQFKGSNWAAIDSIAIDGIAVRTFRATDSVGQVWIGQLTALARGRGSVDLTFDWRNSTSIPATSTATTAAPAVGRTDAQETKQIPVDVMTGAFVAAGLTAGGDIILGVVGPGFPQWALPTGGVVLGNRSGFGTATTVISVPLTATAAQDSLRARARMNGFAPLALAASGRAAAGGFVSTTSTNPSDLCRAGESVGFNAWPRATGGSIVAITHTVRGAACADVVSGRGEGPPGGRGALPVSGSAIVRTPMISLQPPTGAWQRSDLASAPIVGEIRAAGAVRSDLTTAALLRHYADQMRAVGWISVDSAASRSIGVQTFRLTEASGVVWHGAISIANPGSGFAIELRYYSQRMVVPSG